MGGLAETDDYGMPAFACSADSKMLECVADAPGVLQCPACGHRTDTPGAGTLDDGFDIFHRQWGLRGSLHAWRAIRELVASTPTPPDRDAVRAAYVDAMRRAADIDLDGDDDGVVYRRQLDHGGMSGGAVDIGWWRTKMIPLLVDRAVDRRPLPRTTPVEAAPRPPVPQTPTAARGAKPTRSVKTVLGDIAVWGIVIAIPLALLGGGGFLLYQRAVGTRVEATVLECDTSGAIVRGTSTYRTDCIAEWTIDGRPVIGAFTGGDGESDVGKTVDATVRGDTAYSRSLGLPILLIALGLPVLAFIIIALRGRRRSTVS